MVSSADGEWFDHAVRDVWLPVLRIGDEAEQRVVAGREVERDVVERALRQSNGSSQRRERRRTLGRLDPREHFLWLFPRRELRDEHLVRLLRRVAHADDVLTARERTGEREVVV